MNWGAGIRGLGAAWILLSIGAWHHSTLPLFTAGLITAFSLFVPLRIGYILFSREFAGLVLRTSILVLVATAIAYPASLAANSAQPPIAAIGSLLFIGLLTATGAVLLFAAKTAAARSVPGLVPILKHARARAHGWVVQIAAAMKSA